MVLCKIIIFKNRIMKKLFGRRVKAVYLLYIIYIYFSIIYVLCIRYLQTKYPFPKFEHWMEDLHLL